MEVQFNEHAELQFPSKCACCMQETKDTRISYRHTVKLGLFESQTKTRKLPVPYCKFCRDHVDWTEGGSWFGLLLSIPVNAFFWGMLAFMLVFMWQSLSTWALENERFSTGVGMAAVAVVVGIAAWLRVRKRPGRVMGRHARRGESVEIISYKGSGRLTARVHNPQWAELWLSMNPDLIRSR